MAACVVVLTTPAERLFAQPTNIAPLIPDILVTNIEDRVEVLRAGARTWDLAYANQSLHAGDRLRVSERGRVALLLSDQSVARFGSLSDFTIEAPAAPNKQQGFSLSRGLFYFFHRGKPADIQIRTRTASAAVRGTEFNLEAEEDGRAILTMLDGEVELRNAQGRISLTNGEQGIAEPGKRPTKTAAINAINVIQWALYYPAVLDLDELSLSQEEQQSLERSLAAYRSGDLLQALADYPAERTPVSSAEKVYLGALLLVVGQVAQAEKLFDSLPQNVGAGATNDTNAALAGAVRQLVAAVKLQPWQRSRAPELATEWLAESYHRQSQADLPEALFEALRAARQAVEKSPNFGFGWARVAELEFSFGRIPEAVEALETSLRLAPRNAEALALKGFLLGAQNRIREAIGYFEQAIAIDGGLGNAWLGRGLCRIRQGQADAGRKDLLMAAALEPQRALLRSYLGKAYGDAGDDERAAKELALARKLDPKDPTAWLYLALLEQQHSQINDAVRDLEKSQELNNNRRVYRSRLLLDQDRAVRSANLANVYRDAGMTDVSLREAGRAVSADYANYSAHLFLANSYDQLRDPNRINLRYETPAESEYLIANLLAPVGAGPLSQNVSQQEYSKLFERDRFGIVSSTEYLSRGAWVEHGAQFGTFQNSSYLVEGLYRTDPGQRPNNDFEEKELHLHLKQQITPQDTVYLRAIYYDAAGGDLIQYYDPGSANLGLRTKESQEPIIHLGYHHEWAPGVHTLLLVARLSERFSLANPRQPTFFIIKEDGVTPSYVQPITINEAYHSVTEIFSTELQQIWQTAAHDTIAGARFQFGDFHVNNRQTDPVAGDSGLFFPPNEPVALQDLRVDFQRLSFYGYHYWQIVNSLQLVAGLSYDRITFPENFNIAPVSKREDSVDRLSPKAGLIWTPCIDATVRFAYTRSLAGAGIDQTFLLEPSHVAGFNQAFRSIIPESVGGAKAAARFETYGVSLEQKLPSRTYLGVSGEILKSDLKRTLGVFEYTGATDFAVPSGTRERLDYEEQALLVTVNQLIGDNWSVGARYRLSKAQIASDFIEIPDGAFITDPLFRPRQELDATLHQLSLQANYNTPGGFFAQFQALWNRQSNAGYEPDIPGDDFWQFNLFAGYRFPRRRAELGVGILNLTDRDYRLNPLTLYNELPRERTFVTRFSFSF
jgi:tetratricopeptide (TPR) repeat protein